MPGVRQVKRYVFLDDATFDFYVRAGGVYTEGARAGKPRGASWGMRTIAQKWLVFRNGVEVGVKNGNLLPDLLEIFKINGQEV